MAAGSWSTATAGLVGALVGALASYLGAARASRSASTAAWAGHTIAVAEALLNSDDPAVRAAGTHLLAASVRAIADAPETPEKIKQATRSGDLADAVDEVRTVEESGEPAEIELAEEDDDEPEGQGHPQAG